MPTIGWFEILIVVGIAIIVLGPKDFPIMLKKAGSWIGTAKKYMRDIQSEVSNIEIFLENFNNNKEKIRNFKGCRLLELYRDKKEPTIFFTYSYWESEQDLENYRKSELFKTVWTKTKKLFNKKPEAWSVDKHFVSE